MYTFPSRRTRSPTSKHTVRHPLRLEDLESRDVPDGTVVVSWTNNVLTFTGDWRANQVIVSENAYGVFGFTSNNGTRFVKPSGQVITSTADFHRGPFTGTMKAVLAQGDDAFFVGHNGYHTRLLDIIMSDTGGSDVLWVTNGSGGMLVRHIICTQGTNDTGADSLLVSSLVPNAPIYVAGNINFSGGGGIDQIYLAPAQVNGSVSIYCGGVTGDKMSFLTKIGGNLSVDLLSRSVSSQRHQVDLTNTNVTGRTLVTSRGSTNTNVTGRGGNFKAGLQLIATQGANQYIDMGGLTGQYISITSGGSSVASVKLADILLTGGLKVDSSHVTSRETFFLTNSVIGGNFSLIGSPGSDEIEIRMSTIRSNLSVNFGTGNSTVSKFTIATVSTVQGSFTVTASPQSRSVEEVWTGSVYLMGAVSIVTGGGNDLVWLGHAGRFGSSVGISTGSSYTPNYDRDTVNVLGDCQFYRSVYVGTGIGSDSVRFDPFDATMCIYGNLTVSVGTADAADTLYVGNWSTALRIDGSQKYVGDWYTIDTLQKGWIT